MGSVKSAEGSASDVTVTHWKTQWIILASSNREPNDLKYEERPNKEDYITDKRKIDFMEASFSQHGLPVNADNVPACPVPFKRAMGPFHCKHYCFKDSVGTDHQIFMIAFPKIEVCSLRFQRICFLELRRKQFVII